jgi:hypothetical protein
MLSLILVLKSPNIVALPTVHYSNMLLTMFKLSNVQGCNQTVYDVYNMTEETRAKKKDYGVKALPTAIIDGKSKLLVMPKPGSRPTDF